MAEFLAQRVGEARLGCQGALVAGREGGEGFEVLSDPKAGLLVGEEWCSSVGAERSEGGGDVCMPGGVPLRWDRRLILQGRCQRTRRAAAAG